MKNMRKILSLVLALMMVLSLSVTAFADGTATYTVTIYVQDAYRNADGGVDLSYIYNDGVPASVTVAAGQTLKDAINAACSQTNSFISSPVWDVEHPEFLSAMDVDGATYANDDSFTYDSPEVGKATYEGLSWMYFDGAPSDMPASSYDYPDVSLGGRIVNSNMVITLSYEYLIYIWEY